MPYKITPKGEQALKDSWQLAALTDNQRLALQYLDMFGDKVAVPSGDIAAFYNMAPQAMRGPCWWLKEKGLIEIEDG